MAALIETCKVRLHDAAVAAATATSSCHNNWIPLYLMELLWQWHRK